MGIYKRKQVSKKTNKNVLDQESDQEKKERKHALEQESDQEKKLSFFLSYFLVFFYKFSPQISDP